MDLQTPNEGLGSSHFEPPSERQPACFLWGLSSGGHPRMHGTAMRWNHFWLLDRPLASRPRQHRSKISFMLAQMMSDNPVPALRNKADQVLVWCRGIHGRSLTTGASSCHEQGARSSGGGAYGVDSHSAGFQYISVFLRFSLLLSCFKLVAALPGMGCSQTPALLESSCNSPGLPTPRD